MEEKRIMDYGESFGWESSEFLTCACCFARVVKFQSQSLNIVLLVILPFSMEDISDLMSLFDVLFGDFGKSYEFRI